MPRQRRTLYPDRKPLDPRKHNQFPESIRIKFAVAAGQHSMESLEEHPRLLDRLSFHRFAHHRCAARPDRAPRSFETDVGDYTVGDFHPNRQPVAATAVMSFSMTTGIAHFPKVPRLFRVIRDHLAIQLDRFSRRQIHNALSARPCTFLIIPARPLRRCELMNSSR